MNARIHFAANGRVSERVFALGLWCTAAVVTGVSIWILSDLVQRGSGQLDFGFLIESPKGAGRAGGIAPILVATAMILAIALATAVPLSLGAAIWLSEFTRRGGWLSTVVQRGLDVLAAVPSIVFGLFGNAFFCNLLGMGYSILAGGLTLALMVLPILIRATEASLRSVPDDYRIAAASLGVSRTRSTVSVLLPAAAPGVLAGLILGAARVLAETAALLFTSGYVDRMPRTVSDSGRALSVHIYDLSMNVPGGESNAYASALVLVAILLILNLGMRVVMTARWTHNSSAA